MRLFIIPGLLITLFDQRFVLQVEPSIVLQDLKGRLGTALADCRDGLHQKRALESSLADTCKEVSSLKEQLMSALYKWSKETASLKERLDRALADSQSTHQQKETAMMARRAAEVC